ncbi:MAG: hypothetical protein JWO38_7123 [Gemmataceae bacterium]|nr:hypothetical protein [Gemmataceae bacterium]
MPPNEPQPTIVRVVDPPSGATLASASGVDIARTAGDGTDGATFTLKSSQLSSQLLHVITPANQISVTDEKRVTWTGPAEVTDGAVVVKARKAAGRVSP